MSEQVALSAVDLPRSCDQAMRKQKGVGKGRKLRRRGRGGLRGKQAPRGIWGRESKACKTRHKIELQKNGAKAFAAFMSDLSVNWNTPVRRGSHNPH